MAKSKGIPDFNLSPFIQLDANDQRFGRVYEGMLKHEKFRKLSPTAKVLYIICITHTLTKKNYTTLHNFNNDEGNEKEYSNSQGYFILSREQLKEYGMNTGSCSRWFKELVQAGFIEYVERNQHRKRANVYKLSNKWKKMRD